MTLLKYLYVGLAALGGFFGASLLWSAGTGFVAGILDMVGIIIPAAALLGVAPLVGLIGAGFSAWKVAA